MVWTFGTVAARPEITRPERTENLVFNFHAKAVSPGGLFNKGWAFAPCRDARKIIKGSSRCLSNF